jgi:hypothetical protein
VPEPVHGGGVWQDGPEGRIDRAVVAHRAMIAAGRPWSTEVSRTRLCPRAAF